MQRNRKERSSQVSGGVASIKQMMNKSALMGPIFALVFLLIALSFVNENFMTTTNIINILRQASVLAVIAVGQTMVIISGGIDLSVASIANISTVVIATYITTPETPWFFIALVVLVLGGLMGMVNGLLITFIKIPPIITTLATSITFGGIAYLYTDGYGVTMPSTNSIVSWGRANIGPIPSLVIIMVIVYLIFNVVMKRTKLGRTVYGLGGNREAVHLSGISVNRNLIYVHIISGVLAAFAGLLLTARLNSGHPTTAENMEMDSIAATVLGGTSVNGGIGTLWGTLIGVFIIIVINNGLTMLGVSPYWQKVAKGLVMIISVGISTVRSKN